MGKSTSTSALVAALRRRGRRVGVLAVDPSSPFSGGALLGDRVRMGEHATDDGVFIRSMASRGHLGGLAWSTPQALRVLDAAGCDVVLVETVGVGQSEVEVVALADTTVVLLAPGMGDGVQAAKAGHPRGRRRPRGQQGGPRRVRAGRCGTSSTRSRCPQDGRADGAGWTRPVVSTVAVRGEGIDELVAALDAHRDWLDGSGARAVRRRARAAPRSRRSRWSRCAGGSATCAAPVRCPPRRPVVAGELDPYRAADELLDSALPAEGTLTESRTQHPV